MSKRIDAIITCPNCKNEFEFELYRSIRGEIPENKELVLSDKINIAICPKCGTSTKLPFPIMYTNVKKRFAIRWEPEYDPQIDQDEKGYAEAFGEGNFYQKAPRIQDRDEFKEKIIEFESNEMVGKPLKPNKEVEQKFKGFIRQEFKETLNDSKSENKLTKGLITLLKFILFIPVCILALGIINIAFSYLVGWVGSLNTFVFILIFIFLGSNIRRLFKFLSAGLIRLISKITPGKSLGFRTFCVLAALNGGIMIYDNWAVPVKYSVGVVIVAIILTVLVIELTVALIIGAASNIKD